MRQNLAIPRYEATRLGQQKGIIHGFFTRQGGVSNGPYTSLNAGLGSNDTPEALAENRQRIMQAMGGRHLQSLAQIHGAKVVEITANSLMQSQQPLTQGDAMVTCEPEVVLGILTADCVPILFADAAVGVIGAAHAGWKGALEGVIEATVSAMERLGATRSQTVVAIGPAIAQESYQVDSLFHAHFCESHPLYEQFFEHDLSKSGHYRFDIKGFVRHQATQAGITLVDVLPEDTYQQESEFYSFRRATHRQESDYGRQLSTIMLQRP